MDGEGLDEGWKEEKKDELMRNGDAKRGWRRLTWMKMLSNLR